MEKKKNPSATLILAQNLLNKSTPLSALAPSILHYMQSFLLVKDLEAIGNAFIFPHLNYCSSLVLCKYIAQLVLPKIALFCKLKIS